MNGEMDEDELEEWKTIFNLFDVDGDQSRENPLLLLRMDENAFLCKSTLMQTSAAQDGSGDGWISFNPLVRCSPPLIIIPVVVPAVDQHMK